MLKEEPVNLNETSVIETFCGSGHKEPNGDVPATSRGSSFSSSLLTNLVRRPEHGPNVNRNRKIDSFNETNIFAPQQ